MKVFDREFFDSLSEAALKSERRRQHRNLHESYDDPSQRLFIALELGTYIRPHRHMQAPKLEFFLCLYGRLGLIVFDDFGEIISSLVFGPNEQTVGAEIPPGVWHMVVCLQSGSILFETKPGPFEQLRAKDFAPWAPSEGAKDVAPYLDKLIRTFC